MYVQILTTFRCVEAEGFTGWSIIPAVVHKYSCKVLAMRYELGDHRVCFFSFNVNFT
jgi:hypothetical protein